MTCPLCVQWRCDTCKSVDWPDCCWDWMDHGGAEPYWPDGSVATIDEQEWCPSCSESVAAYQAEHERDGL